MERASPRQMWALVGILFGSFLFKMALVFRAQDMRLIGDQGLYVHFGRLWVRGERYIVDEANLWPPGYTTFLGLITEHFGRDLFWHRSIQVVLSTATVFFVYVIARAMWRSPRLALVGAAAVGFYPALAGLATYLWAETLYIFFFTGSVAAYVTGLRRDHLGWFALGGVSFALAALTKSIGLYTMAPWLLWHAWQGRGRPRRAAGQAAALLVAAGLCIAPWTVRNYYEFDRFVLIDMSLGRNLYYGHNAQGPKAFDYGLERPFSRKSGLNRTRCDELPGMTHPKDVEECEVRGALTFIRENPGVTLMRFGTKMADLFSPTSNLVAMLGREVYRNPPQGVWKYGAMGLTILAWMAVGVGVVAALTLTRWGPCRWWMVGLLAYFMLVHWATVGQARYRASLEPFLILMAVEGLRYGLPRLFEDRGWSRRAGLFYGLMAVVVWMWSTRWMTGPSEVLTWFFG